MASYDLEDIVNLIDARPELIDEIAHSPNDLRIYLAEQCQLLLDTDAFHDGLLGQIIPGSPQGAQAASITQRITQIAQLA